MIMENISLQICLNKGLLSEEHCRYGLLKLKTVVEKTPRKLRRIVFHGCLTPFGFKNIAPNFFASRFYIFDKLNYVITKGLYYRLIAVQRIFVQDVKLMRGS